MGQESKTQTNTNAQVTLKMMLGGANYISHYGWKLKYHPYYPNVWNTIRH